MPLATRHGARGAAIAGSIVVTLVMHHTVLAQTGRAGDMTSLPSAA